jgi:hypothetical protein
LNTRLQIQKSKTAAKAGRRIALPLSTLTVAILVVFACAGSPDTFEFYLPWDDGIDNVVSLSRLNHKPAGAFGYVTAGSDGHLYVNSGADRIRFLGVNFPSSSCFPSHADADKIAERLAKYGVNLVRWMTMDTSWGDVSLIDYGAGNSCTLDASALDKFDYFFFRLKKQGIYSDINLLAGRDFMSTDGLPAEIDTMDWKDQQTPAMFDPAIIDLQKQYATNLLSHRNPYTELTYAEDPAVALVEVCNEHGLVHAWYAGHMDRLPASFNAELQSMWNAYLQDKYTDFTSLQSAWGVWESFGPEKLTNPDFASDISSWVVEQHAPAVRSYVVTPNGHSPGVNSLDVTVTTTSPADWHVQLNQRTSLLAGHPYTLSFSAKASANTTVRVCLQEVGSDWTEHFGRDIDLTTSWQTFEFVSVNSEAEPVGRLNFSKMADEALTYSFADFSFRQGGTITGLKPGETDFDKVDIFYVADQFDRTNPAKQDWVDFLWDKEFSYWSEMNEHLKTTLGIKALTTGTIIGNSSPNIMKLFDVIDSHAYWQHPVSLVVPWEDPWYLRNSSLVGETNGGTIAGLGMKRVYGKPFAVTEYNHPFPNTFDSEAYIFLSCYAAFQDWDAICLYTYADGTRSWSVNRQDGHFEYHSHPGKMMSFIPAANMFRRGDISPGAQLLRVTMGTAVEKRLLMTAGEQWRLVDAEHVGMNYRTPLLYRCAIVPEGFQDPGGLAPGDIAVPADFNHVSEGGELHWYGGKKVLTIDSPRTKGVLGYSMGRQYNLGGFVFRPQCAMQNWASITATVLRGSTLTSGAENILITAHGVVGNTGMTYRTYPDNDPTTYPPPADVNITIPRSNPSEWGTSPVMVEGIGCEFVVPYACSSVNVYSLDGYGNRLRPLPIRNERGKAKFEINGTYKTLWYEVEIGSN